MAALRIHPAAQLSVNNQGVILHSELGTRLIAGAEVKKLAHAIMPLLDGTRERPEIINGFGGELAPSCSMLLDLLERHGVVDAVSWPATGGRHSDDGQDRFFRTQGCDPEETRRRLRMSRILVAGLEPWTAAAAVQLARAGVGHLHLLDNRPVTAGDLPAGSSPDAIGCPRLKILSQVIASRVPECKVTNGSFPQGEPLAEGLPEAWDIALICALPEESSCLAPSLVYGTGVKALYSSIRGMECIVGPLASPGESPCWRCCDARLRANEERPLDAENMSKHLEYNSSRLSLLPAAELLGNLLALETLKIVTGYAPSRLAGSVLIQNLVTLEASWHSVLPLPWCGTCGGAMNDTSGLSSQAGHPEQTSSTKLLRDLTEMYVDRRVGVIRNIGLREVDPSGPKMPVCAWALPCAGTSDTYSGGDLETTGGKGTTDTEALLGAVAEAIERYSSSLADPERLHCSSLRALAPDVLDPRDLCLYEECQYEQPGFPFRRFDPGQPLTWVRGSWLDNGREVWVPALPAFYRLPPGVEDSFCQVTSSGLAAASCVDDAALRATFELIERDAFMLTWLCGKACQRIDTGGIPEPMTRTCIQELEKIGVTVELYALDVLGGVHTFLCVGFGDGVTWPGAHVGVAAHTDPRQAARKAVLEMAYSGSYVRRRLLAAKDPLPTLEPGQLRTFGDHAHYYIPPERATAFHFLRSSNKSCISLDDVSEKIEPGARQLGKRLLEDGIRVAIVDVTAPDIYRGPLRVVRALATYLHPVHCGAGLERLDSRRLKALGGRVNREPHPLC